MLQGRNPARPLEPGNPHHLSSPRGRSFPTPHCFLFCEIKSKKYPFQWILHEFLHQLHVLCSLRREWMETWDVTIMLQSVTYMWSTHRSLILEDLPRYLCSCSLWQLKFDFCSGSLSRGENGNDHRMLIMRTIKSRPHYHPHFIGSILAFWRALLTTPVCRPALDVSFFI